MTDNDYDEEFKRLTADLADDEILGMEEEFHANAGKLCVALVLAPFPSAGALTEYLRRAGISVPVVRVDRWAAAYLEVEGKSSEDDEMAGLVTGARPVPEPVDRLARDISKTSSYGAIALMSWLTEDDGYEPGVSGIVTAKRYLAGQPAEDMNAGVLLGGLDGRVEDLLLGRTKPKDYGENDRRRWFFGRGNK